MKRVEGEIVKFKFRNEQIYFFCNDKNDLIQKFLLSGSFYEIEELELIENFVNKFDKILDIGANIGNHAIYFAKFLGSHKVTVIEPNPLAYEILKINSRLNSLDGIIDESYLGIGVSDTTYTGTMIIVPKNIGASKVIPMKNSKENINFLVTPIDKLIHDPYYDFIKIDVEGMEIEVLLGMQNLIKKCSPDIFIEVFDKNFDRFKEFCKKYKYKIVAKYKRYQANTNYIIKKM